MAWGNNNYGQTNVPPGATNVIALAAGRYHSLALRADGTVIGWGLNTSGQATALSNAVNAVAIAAGRDQSLALLQDGSAVGRINTNSSTRGLSYGPPPADATNLTAISAGAYHALGLRSDKTVTGWGVTNYGLLNPPSYATNVLALAAGGVLNLALVPDPAAPPIPPRIARPPLGREIVAGQRVVLNALAVGGLPLRYQWYRGTTPVPDQTRPWLALTNVLPGEAGSYQLVAMNDFGSATSSVASVTVTIPQPQLTPGGEGSSRFSLTFQGIDGVLYVTEYKTNLNDALWLELSRQTGTGGPLTVEDPSPAGPNRFYRVKVE